jgi:ribonuclease BN (tRNA processing enzyme)
MRVEVAGKVIAYTGDSEWTEHMPVLADGADLFIAECYFFSKPVRFHLNYPDIAARKSEIRAKRIVLTHLGREMLANLDNVPEECAHDGLVIQLPAFVGSDRWLKSRFPPGMLPASARGCSASQNVPAT